MYTYIYIYMNFLRLVQYEIIKPDISFLCSCSHIHSRFDLLVWFEICELAPNGE